MTCPTGAPRRTPWRTAQRRLSVSRPQVYLTTIMCPADGGRALSGVKVLKTTLLTIFGCTWRPLSRLMGSRLWLPPPLLPQALSQRPLPSSASRPARRCAAPDARSLRLSCEGPCAAVTARVCLTAPCPPTLFPASALRQQPEHEAFQGQAQGEPVPRLLPLWQGAAGVRDQNEASTRAGAQAD